MAEAMAILVPEVSVIAYLLNISRVAQPAMSIIFASAIVAQRSWRATACRECRKFAGRPTAMSLSGNAPRDVSVKVAEHFVRRRRSCHALRVPGA
jgi:hypothetical protein